MPLALGATVPYQSSFLLIGGYCSSCPGNIMDTVIRYAEDGEWETLPLRLDMKRNKFIAIPKPAC